MDNSLVHHLANNISLIVTTLMIGWGFWKLYENNRPQYATKFVIAFLLILGHFWIRYWWSALEFPKDGDSISWMRAISTLMLVAGSTLVWGVIEEVSNRKQAIIAIAFIILGVIFTV